MLFYASGRTWSSRLWNQCKSKSAFSLRNNFLWVLLLFQVYNQKSWKDAVSVKTPPLILSSFTNLNRWSYITNGKKEWYSSTWSGATKLGFVELNTAFNIPKIVSFKGCWQLSTLLPVVMTKVTSLVLYNLATFLLQLLGKTVSKFQSSNTLLSVLCWIFEGTNVL